MSHALIKQLTEKRQNIWDQTKALLDGAADENRDLSAEEQEQYERLSKDMSELRQRIDSVTSTMEENRAAEEALKNAVGTGDKRKDPEATDVEARLRAFLAGETRSVDISAADMREPWKRALAKGTATAGGNTVPTSFYDQLVQHMVDASGLLQAGPTILNTDGGETLEIPITTSHGAAALVGEATPITGTDPTFGKRTLGAYKYGQLIKVSSELAQDTGVDLEGYIADVAGRNVGLALAAHLIGGTGTNQPTGLLTTATAGKTGAGSAGGAFTADDLIDLFFSVIAPYRNSRSAAWLVRDASLGGVRKLKDGAGRYLFEPAATFGAPDTLLGKPIYTDPNVPAVAADAKSVIFGDISRYFVRLAGGVRFERSTDYAFNTDEITFRAIVRGDGVLVDQTGAVKTFTGGAA